MEVKYTTPPKSLTLGTCLTTLYALSKPIYRSQQSFYTALFQNYHQELSELYEIEWATSQSDINRIMRGQKQMPWEQREYYLLNNGDIHLRIAVQQYLDSVIQTEKQRITHHDRLLIFVQRCNNLTAKDKKYILAYNKVNCDEHLYELVYRMLFVAMREPITRKQVS